MTETAILGGGCFWCTEAVFLALRGVLAAAPGYAGGHVDRPTYEAVCAKATGHIEVVRVVFDPAIIDFSTLLKVFFATHDPTTLDRQGADVGPQYASAIFCQSDAQRDTAVAVIEEVQAALGEPVVTQVRDAATFWPAEDYHHDFYARNPWQGYCQAVISPKMAKLRRHYARLLST
ncbi:peptide-methionine (S)-S-oxide reductase MsrA [Paracandidimonas lactea]|uniref:peptide-methionine (S)-S-oxide reductase MsrA n=1 Tax=Paracandidimonas lactea TaxID=2895524 RepID=UPI001F00F2FE|nr:peptide-methionine (S)-S-oxide reductase MsrA [Paracandidimonas lactea]